MGHSIAVHPDPRAAGVVIPQILRRPGGVVAQMDIVIPSRLARVACRAVQRQSMALIGEFAPVAGAAMGASDAH